MQKIVILMNCLGYEIENYFKNIPEIKNFYEVIMITSYLNLDNINIDKHIKECDILITNNIKNYPLMSYENLCKLIKPTSKIVKIEFIRFNGYFPLPHRYHANFLEVYDASTDTSDFEYYKNFYVSKEEIILNFEMALNKLKKLDEQSDIKFFDFFINNHKNVLLFRDNMHITHTYIKHIVKELLFFLKINITTSIDNLFLEYTSAFKFRVRPILNCVINNLELNFDNKTVNIFNKNISIDDYFILIQKAKECENIKSTEQLFLLK